MDNPILLITALAPGFIGIAVQKLLNGDTTTETIQQGILKYFLFAASALLVTDACLRFNGPVSRILQQEPLRYIDCLVPMGIAVVLSVLWHVRGCKWIIRVANIINTWAGKNQIFLRTNMLEEMLNDGKPHFLDIKFPDGTQTCGYLSKVVAHDKNLMLEPEPKWTKDTAYKRKTVRQLIDLNSNTIVTEYEYIAR